MTNLKWDKLTFPFSATGIEMNKIDLDELYVQI